MNPPDDAAMTETPKTQEPLESERIQEVTRVVLSVLEEWQGADQKPAGFCCRALDWINAHWAIVAGLIAAVLSVSYLFLASYKYGSKYDIDFLHPVAKIAYEQKKSKQEIAEYEVKEKEREFIRRMVKCRLQCGNEFLNAGLNEEAKKEFDAAQNLDKTNTEVQLGLLKSRVFELSQGEYNPEVIEKRIKVIEHENKDDPHVFLFRGTMYYALQKYGEAERNLLVATKLDDKVASAHYLLGLIYDKTNKPDEALKEFECAVRQSKWNRSYLNNLASLCYRKKRYSEAIGKYEEVIQLDPGYLLPYAEISRILRLNGKEALDVEKAEKYQRALLRELERDMASSKDPKIEKVTLSVKNANPWYFYAEGKKNEGSDRIYLSRLEEKLVYAYYTLAVTLYLENKAPKAQKLLNMAPKLRWGEQLNLMSLIVDEVSCLDKERPGYKVQIDKIKQELFPKMMPAERPIATGNP